MKMSLVVCTRNRATQLAQALPHLASILLEEPWELVLVNNGSSDKTAEVLRDFSAAARMKVKIVDQPKPGLSAARNAGWRTATGHIVTFTDDDCYPAPDFLQRVRDCFADSQIGYLGGRILLYDKDDYPVTIQPLARRIDIAPRSFVRAGLIHGANFSFRRDVLEAIGDFDEKLGAGTKLQCGEDVDILRRASFAGFPGVYDPSPLVFHHHRRRSHADVDRLKAGYDLGRGAYYVKALLDNRSRSTYLKPILRSIRGYITERDFAALRREALGALKYVFS